MIAEMPSSQSEKIIMYFYFFKFLLKLFPNCNYRKHDQCNNMKQTKPIIYIH